MTEVVILRNSSLISTLLVFLPIALASWHWQNPHFLWLALVCFMLSRLMILGLALPKTFVIDGGLSRTKINGLGEREQVRLPHTTRQLLDQRFVCQS
jgi:hypothetical protein